VENYACTTFTHFVVSFLVSRHVFFAFLCRSATVLWSSQEPLIIKNCLDPGFYLLLHVPFPHSGARPPPLPAFPRVSSEW